MKWTRFSDQKFDFLEVKWFFLDFSKFYDILLSKFLGPHFLGWRFCAGRPLKSTDLAQKRQIWQHCWASSLLLTRKSKWILFIVQPIICLLWMVWRLVSLETFDVLPFLNYFTSTAFTQQILLISEYWDSTKIFGRDCAETEITRFFRRKSLVMLSRNLLYIFHFGSRY